MKNRFHFINTICDMTDTQNTAAEGAKLTLQKVSAYTKLAGLQQKCNNLGGFYAGWTRQ